MSPAFNVVQVVVKHPELVKRIESVAALMQRTVKQTEAAERRTSLKGKPGAPPSASRSARESAHDHAPSHRMNGAIKPATVTKGADHSVVCVTMLKALLAALAQTHS